MKINDAFPAFFVFFFPLEEVVFSDGGKLLLEEPQVRLCSAVR